MLATETSKCARLGIFCTALLGWPADPARYDRRVLNAEAAGSNPARSIMRYGFQPQVRRKRHFFKTAYY